MYLCIFEDEGVRRLEPLVLTRAAADLRIGIRTLAQRLADAFPDATVLYHCRDYLASVSAQEDDVLVNRIPGTLDVLFVNGRWFVEDGEAVRAVREALAHDERRVFVQDGTCVAAWVPRAKSSIVESTFLGPDSFGSAQTDEISGARMIDRLWHLLDLLPTALADDFSHHTRGFNIYERPGASIHESAILAAGERIFVGPGAAIRPGAILNAEDGPIFVDRDAIVMENAVIRGPAYVGPKSQVKVGASISGSSLGTYCKVGGEVEHSILHSYSAKAHAGFLGHAYLGRWCNIGADTNNSNLKNDYGPVSLYDAETGDFESTDRQFLGMIMGDHSKSGINAMFNTGTVVGTFCNVYGSGFLPRFIPSFSWGTPEQLTTYRLEKALRVAEAVMARRDMSLTDADRDMLTHVFEQTASQRTDVFGE